MKICKATGRECSYCNPGACGSRIEKEPETDQKYSEEIYAYLMQTEDAELDEDGRDKEIYAYLMQTEDDELDEAGREWVDKRTNS